MLLKGVPRLKHISYDANITNGTTELDPNFWYIMTTTHAYAILPKKMRTMKAYLPLSML